MLENFFFNLEKPTTFKTTRKTYSWSKFKVRNIGGEIQTPPLIVPRTRSAWIAGVRHDYIRKGGISLTYYELLGDT